MLLESSSGRKTDKLLTKSMGEFLKNERFFKFLRGVSRGIRKRMSGRIREEIFKSFTGEFLKDFP